MDVTLQKSMRPYDDVDLAYLQTFDRSRLRLIVDKPREHLDRDGEFAQPLAKDMEVLLGKNSGRRQKSDLLAAHRCFERGPQGQLGLPETDISAEQPVHGPIGLHVSLDLRERRHLIGCLLIRKGGL